MDEETKTALDDNELFKRLELEMKDIMLLVKCLRKEQRILAIRELARQASSKIENVRSELYFLQEAVEDMSDKALATLLY